MAEDRPSDQRPVDLPETDGSGNGNGAASGGAHREPPPVTPLDIPRRAPAGGGGEGCRRPALVGAVGVAVVLLLLLVAGLQLTRRTVWMTTERAVDRVRHAARDAPLDPAERDRLLSALDRLEERMPMMDDPYPAMGAILNRVQQDLEDGRLSREEATGLAELASDLAAGRTPP